MSSTTVVDLVLMTRSVPPGSLTEKYVNIYSTTFSSRSLPVDLSLAVPACSDGRDLLNARCVLSASELECFAKVVKTDQGGAMVGHVSCCDLVFWMYLTICIFKDPLIFSKVVR